MIFVAGFVSTDTIDTETGEALFPPTKDTIKKAVKDAVTPVLQSALRGVPHTVVTDVSALPDLRGRRLLFAMALEDNSARRLAAGRMIRVKIPVQSLQKAYDTEYASGNKGRSETITATLREVAPPLGEPADMRRVLWEIDNRSHLLEPLTYNNVTVKADQTYDCLTVPLTAMSDSSFDSVLCFFNNRWMIFSSTLSDL